MLFLTYWFVCFSSSVYPAYWLCPAPVRRWILLISCLIFHAHFAGAAGVIPICVLGFLTYLCGRSQIQGACTLAIVANVASLAFYKYALFLCTQFLGLFSGPSSATWLVQIKPFLKVTPPLAISFFVFEFVHYLVDVRRGGQPIRSLGDFILFAVFWPSIVAGPIKRYQTFMPQLKGTLDVSSVDIAIGLCGVALGMVKKIAADNLTVIINNWAPNFAVSALVTRWEFVGMLALRILWDFSGYSDMAIGFARMLGFRLPMNFNWPYLATSITDFWHRWHMSLSLWIRDYIYIALGGNRLGTARRLMNGLLAFAICGLWHGAGWNFLVWGVYHGLLIAVASSYRRFLGVIGESVHRVMVAIPPLGWLLTQLFVSVGWLLFFYPVAEAAKMASLLTTWGG